MTSTTDNTASRSHLARFQTLLRELFQFDEADLDFGIYRIMNHKRATILRFINESLPDEVDKALNSEYLSEQARTAAALEDARIQVKEKLGDDAIDNNENLVTHLHATPIGKQYLACKKAVEETKARSHADTEVRIYNHLYTFFSRYYQDGDFVSKRRYSRNQRYIIPYNGEEIYFHWANSDQYYIKTDEYFYNYDWKTPNGVTVKFQIHNADVEHNNVKGDRRFFLPIVSEMEYVSDNSTITIPFEYRPLKSGEGSTYGKQQQQEKIIYKAIEDIIHQIRGQPDALTALTTQQRKNSKGESISHLEHHLRKYTSRNEADFFIHKNLSSFLSRELDYYLKNELLDLDNLATAGLKLAQADFQIIRLIKKIATQIIKFLSQIEDFQKMLWEKRKFVIKTGYCIALSSIDKSLYRDIISNNEQWQEWCELYGFKDNERNDHFCDSRPTLMLDTRHFDDAMTDHLLALFDNLDDITDGVVIKGDNWQALTMMSNKYRNKVQCVYIDPPYNTAASEIIYKNGYKHSSWLTLMKERIVLSQHIMSDDAVLVVAIDDTEMVGLSQLLDIAVPNWDRNTVVVNHHPAGSGLEGANVSSTHEYALFMTPIGKQVLAGAPKNDSTSKVGFTRTGAAESNLRAGRPNSFYAVLVDPDSSAVIDVEPPPEGDTYPLENTRDGLIRIYPRGRDGTERVWRRSYKGVARALKKGELVCKNNRSLYLITDQVGKRRPLFSNWTDKRFNAGVHGSNLLKNLFGKGSLFSYPKSIHTVRVCIDACTHNSPNAIILDYFAGSGTTGHAVINLNREDGGRRKFLLVEMGKHFDTVLLPRIKKVVYSPEWKGGAPCRTITKEEASRSPHIIKYLILESYEDALDSVIFDKELGQQQLEDRFGDEYLLKYMLSWETKTSTSLVNVDRMTQPFSYKLEVFSDGAKYDKTVDLPETFNWLLGLTVHTRRVYNDKSRRYLVYRGETLDHPGHRVVVIWRETDGWDQDDYARDRRFIRDNGIAVGIDTVYINGGSCIPGAKSIEPIFKARMFAPING